jgi:hypothetical protein
MASSFNTKWLLGLLAVALIAAIVFATNGSFSVIGSGGFDEYPRDDGNDAAFRGGEDLRCDDPMECEPSVFNPSERGCTVVNVDSIATAAEELGADAYFALTAERSLAEINGVVYACE